MVGIAVEETLKKVTTFSPKFGDDLGNRGGGMVDGERFVVRELVVTWPRVFGRCPQQFENPF